jgi:hypothetical protein
VVETGSVTFASDGSYTSTFQQTGTESFTTPAQCGTAAADCAQRCAFFGWPSGKATPDGSGCTCSQPIAKSGSPSGSYTTTGAGVLTVAGESTSYSYCVQGNTLAITGIDERYLTAAYMRQ